MGAGDGASPRTGERARWIRLSCDGQLRHARPAACIRPLGGSGRWLRLCGNSRQPSVGGLRRAGHDPRTGWRGLQGRPRAAARVAAARASGSPQPCLGADERRHDQGRRLRVRPYRLRSGRPPRMVVEHRGAHARRHYGRDGRALRAHAARPQAAARLPHRGKYRNHLHRARPRARVQDARRGLCGSAGDDGRPAARVQPLGLQELAVLRRRRCAHCDRRARHGASRRPHPSHAADGLRVSRGLRRDISLAAAQWLCLGVADLPGHPAEPAVIVLGSQAAGARRRSTARAVGGACRRLLCQGIRRDFSRAPAHSGGGACAGNRPVLARRDVLPRRTLPGRGNSAGTVHRCARAGRAGVCRGTDAGAGRRRMALDCADRRKSQFLQRTARVPVHGHIRDADGVRYPPTGIRSATACARLGLWLSRSQSGHAIQRVKLRPANPPRLRDRRLPRARAWRDAPTGRHTAGAPDRGVARPRLGRSLRARRQRGRLCRRPAQPTAVPDHPSIPQSCLRLPGDPAAGAGDMAVIVDLAVQGAQMLLVLLLAPLLTGLVRKTKARFLRRRGPPLLQPYRDLVRLMRKEVVLAESASWLFRVIPYIVFAATWVAASLVPTFRTGLLFSWSADLIAIIALLGSARFFLALAGMDVGTSFGGIGSSREVMIASLAEPAMVMIVFTLALALIALIIVAIAENARIPVDNPATHLELTMVHEAMVLEYSGRHLALIEAAAALKLVLYFSLIICLFMPFGIAGPGAGLSDYLLGIVAYLAKLLVLAVLLPISETTVAKMRVFRYTLFAGSAFAAAALAVFLLFVSKGF